MAIETLNFSGAPGAAVSAVNTGFSSWQYLDPGSTAIFDPSATPWEPFMSPSIIVEGSTQAGHVFGYVEIPDTNTLAVDEPWMPLVFGATPSSDNQIFSLISTTTGSEVRNFSINVRNHGGLRILDGAATQTNTVTGLLTVGTKYILKVYVLRHATAGAWHVKVMNEDETVTVYDSGLITGVPTGANPINRIRAGIGKAGTTNVTPAKHQWGELRWDSARTSLLPKWAMPNPFYMWFNDVGAYENVDVYFWDSSTGGYTQLGVM